MSSYVDEGHDHPGDRVAVLEDFAEVAGRKEVTLLTGQDQADDRNGRGGRSCETGQKQAGITAETGQACRRSARFDNFWNPLNP